MQNGDLEEAVARLKHSVATVRAGLSEVEASQRETLVRLQAVEEAQRETLVRLQAVEEAQRETNERTEDVGRHFDTFLMRFNETLEMLVVHDTDQLQRVAAVERDNAVLRQQYGEFLERLEAVERKLAS